MKVGDAVVLLEDLIDAMPAILAQKGEHALITKVNEITEKCPWKYTILVQEGHYVYVHPEQIELINAQTSTETG